ncbi:hypothetical protein QVN96_13915 [Mediterraneibacter glycyrrhizinilyticus]|uniref:hypothetical protein n=1 Tax=Mediterraneibacter glycyrrhizinilyticus TaxID=342942 RepID=UPI0025AAF40F|nr:hypothetical protein [Mediterraneibacter glycyrrhizinilyticus]MDN0062479.1 hypothetical protein [Mediterraneibacter glycyrrhizinilyticus]
MDTNSIRLDAMKKYCEMAIRLERETDFWNSMADQAERKMQEYKKEHIRQNRLASEAQSQLNMMENFIIQKVSRNNLEIQRRQKYCRISLLVICLMLLGVIAVTVISAAFIMSSPQLEHTGQKVVFIISVFISVLSFLFLPFIICLVVFFLNKSKQNNLQREIAGSSLGNEERRKKEIFSDQLEKAENESNRLTAQEQILSKQQYEIREAGEEVRRRKDEFYAAGELPKIYQNLDAVISFFYYLDNKLVDTIEGADGMYTRYHLDCQHREQMAELRGIRGAIEEHERHEQMRHKELIGTLQVYGTAILAQLGRIGSDLSQIRKVQENFWEDYTHYDPTHTTRKGHW